MDETKRKQVAAAVIHALESQSGIDVLPAQAALPRILTGIFKITGFKFKHIGHGRMRDVFDIVSPSGDDLGLALKLGSKQATARDIALTLVYPEDRARIYAATDYGVVVERVDFIMNIGDPRIKTPEFQARMAALEERYVGLTYQDLGYIRDTIVVIGSSTRVLKQDALKPGSASQQWRAE